MKIKSRDSFQTVNSFKVDSETYHFFSLRKLSEKFDLSHLPYVVKILLENLLRHEDGKSVQASDIELLSKWAASAGGDQEISFMPARVLLQDFTGVPAVVDLAVMRDAVKNLKGDPKRINPILPAELVIDHSIQVDSFAREGAMEINSQKDYERNGERYAFLRWGQAAFSNFKVVPPNTGICHQVNLEYLARVVFDESSEGKKWAYPDTVVGTDSHTTMINGLGVLGWGVGGIEAEAAMLGQSIPLSIPRVVGVRLSGRLGEGITATDLVLTVAEALRKHGVVGKFVEFYGEGLPDLTIADRATLGNMSPEYGATCAIFPIDGATLEYLRFTGRDPKRIALVEAYAKEQGLFSSNDSPVQAHYTETLELDLSKVEPSLAGPRLPHQRVSLSQVRRSFHKALLDDARPHEKPIHATGRMEGEGGHNDCGSLEPVPVRKKVKVEHQTEFELHDGAVVIAAITSCTNTSNPAVLLGAGLLARNAVNRGLRSKPWVKTSLAPGSMVVTEYLRAAGLSAPLEELGFHLVGYGCTTCIGNSGPLPDPIARAVEAEKLYVCSVLSGNRNFEGRIHPLVRGNYLASPPLVVAYALAGSVEVDLEKDPLGFDSKGKPVYLKEIWPSKSEIAEVLRRALKPSMFVEKYSTIDQGDGRWKSLQTPKGDLYDWREDSTYLRQAPYFEGLSKEVAALKDIEGGRLLARLGDSITTDHISPAGSIAKNSPAGKYLIEKGVSPAEFNSYGARRGNHEVMIRGTFANVRLKNQLVPGVEGGVTRHFPDGKEMSIYEAAMRYQTEGVPLIVLAGKDYGSGSSRDWAAKGTRLLGVRAVIARSFERIHRSNLIGMGVLPLEFLVDEDTNSLGLSGEETFQIQGLSSLKPRQKMTVIAKTPQGIEKRFEVVVRIDTPVELDYYSNGGILNFVLRVLIQK